MDRLDLSEIRKKLAGKRGPEFWKGLEEAAETPEFKAMLDREFPEHASVWDPRFDRRNFLALMGASLALAGLTGCMDLPRDKTVPYVEAPENMIPGVPLFFATAMPWRGYAMGLIAESHMGRPTKLEGNPDHPMSLGAASAINQASLLDLYDPDRAKVVKHQGTSSDRIRFLEFMSRWKRDHAGRKGDGLAFLSETVTSPTLVSQIRELRKKFPKSRWYQYDAISRDNAKRGSLLAFGRVLETHYHFNAARVIVSFDSEFLWGTPASLKYSREYVDGRRIHRELRMNRLYAAEGTPGLEGAVADVRVAVPPRKMRELAHDLAVALGMSPGPARLADPELKKWIHEAAEDLKKNRGHGLVLAGEQQPPEMHALCHGINSHLGGAGKTVDYSEPIAFESSLQWEGLKKLVADMNAGRVDTLVVLGGNPSYSAPADLNFAAATAKVKHKIVLAPYENETAENADWFIPESHYLESWSDGRAADGTVTIIQPLIAPLYDSSTSHDVVEAFNSDQVRTNHDVVREYWRGNSRGMDPDLFWKESLKKGLVAGSAAGFIAAKPRVEFAKVAADLVRPGSSDFEIQIRPDPCVWDGSFNNNGWLQELPKPMTKITWGNAVYVSPKTAEQYSLNNQDMVEVKSGRGTIRGPAFIVPGHADGCLSLQLGYGRTRGGRSGRGLGYNAYALLTTNEGYLPEGAFRKTGEQGSVITTQLFYNMRGRDIVREHELSDYAAVPHGDSELVSKSVTLYGEYAPDQYAWGMSVDLNTCIGCNACVVACQSENNIPVVGRDQVSDHRMMQWLRVDVYYQGDIDNPKAFFQPVPCMHCEKAPCEVVCPVGATTHSAEGLNEMIYNRCVGTRFCSNNCPYKVRRFNFLEYNHLPDVAMLGKNPDVTVRSRGVMEKCTYCVQRINSARITAEKEGRAIRDGEIRTACQQTCPTNAIAFGNILDKDAAVTKLKRLPQNYSLLEELGTWPRTTYLARFRNSPTISGTPKPT